jgi:hypothetical protein
VHENIPTGPLNEPPQANQEQARAMLGQALDGLDLGDYDHQLTGWLADYWEPSTVATIASWLRRAHRRGYSEAAEIAENQTEPPQRRVP